MTTNRASETSRTLRVGVIGAGYMGNRYARLAAQHAGTVLSGVMDLDRVRAESTCALYGGSAFSSLEQLLDRDVVDAVVVSTFEDAHRDACLHALNAGLPVLVEKPIASSIEDARAIVAAAGAARVPLMVGHLLRFDARYSALRDAVRDPAFGSPLTASARRLNGVGAQQRLQGRSSLSAFLGVHDFDLLRWILDDEVVEVSATARRGHLQGMGYPVEDALYATLSFSRGTVAQVELGWILPSGHPSGFDQRMEVTGTAGYGVVDGAFSGFSLATSNRTSWPEMTIASDVGSQLQGSLERSFSAFIQSCAAGGVSPVTALDGLRALEIADAVERSAFTGTVVSLKSQAGSHA